jgi:hypothetical protein
MATESQATPSSETLEIDLRNPAIAGVIAWLVPGAGHLYQRRYAKGILFMVCILGTYFFGLGLADGRVVYASLTKEDFRWQYACQLGVGAPALPALIQNYQVRKDEKDARENQRPVRKREELWLQGAMAPPRGVVASVESHSDYENDELSLWHLQYHSYFELGTLYTMIAGLLNVLAIYDAAAGPVLFSPSGNEKKPNQPPEGKKRKT